MEPRPLEGDASTWGPRTPIHTECSFCSGPGAIIVRVTAKEIVYFCGRVINLPGPELVISPEALEGLELPDGPELICHCGAPYVPRNAKQTECRDCGKVRAQKARRGSHERFKERKALAKQGIEVPAYVGKTPGNKLPVDKQIKLFKLLAEGLKPAKVAEIMHIGRNTVRNYRDGVTPVMPGVRALTPST